MIRRKLEMKQVFSVVFMIAILATMTVVISLDTIPEVEARKGQEVYNPKYGLATKGIVCGDKLYSEIEQEIPSKLSTSNAKSYSSTHTANIISVDSITGASIINTKLDKQSQILEVLISADDDSKMVINLPSIVKDVYMVIVDGEQWDDVHMDENNVRVYFHAGVEKIEILGDVTG